MIRLHFVVEGETEQAFVNAVLLPHLATFHVYASPAVLGGKEHTRRRQHGRGGGGPFSSWGKDIKTFLKSPKSDLRVTMLYDLYGLARDTPGMEECHSIKDTERRCDALQDALARHFNDSRFIPYIQRHEFEALVLCAFECLRGDFTPRALDALAREISSLAPEDINDGPTTAPSKRLKARLGDNYRKHVHGPDAIADYGLEKIRARCPRFNAWVARLESLAREDATQ